MATWGLHMRIAEGLLEQDITLNHKEFIVGNIGPDCGMPNEDWSAFTPPTKISHFKNATTNEIDAQLFYETYIEKANPLEEGYAYLVGYYIHLLTDIKFTAYIQGKIDSDPLYAPLKEDDKFIWTIKKDWYDLDHLYFRDNQESVFYTVFQHVEMFPEYLAHYPQGATIRQIKHITNFYLKSGEDLDRVYQYLTMDEMNTFVKTSLNEFGDIIKTLTNKKTSA